MDARKLSAALLLLWGGLQGCTYSKSYFRIDADGKKIKASGPITPEELSGNTLPSGEETGTGEEGAPAATGSGDEAITPPED